MSRPRTFAPDHEVLAAEAMKKSGKGVFQMIPAGTIGKMESLGGEVPQQEEHALMVRVSEVSGRPVTFTLVQSPDYDPDTERDSLFDRRSEQ